ncbi:outer membrane lipid asymmetry maintenance protein MlaD [Desulfosediminicola flagellatus]|uniref:outer membrane lipid asymmetry maintenance protein MlaD n=1 Tax=Desulfosediminicola flagellatus TaxID=2569541 RepID=UPI0010AC06C1|nr:outer membrane lipid asymmetry maintenance protein MlaD [Desulfosediminicola flagellatus]
MKRGTLEIFVGLFMIAGFSALAYLALNLGEVSIFSSSRTYLLNAEFDNVSGIKKGAAVQVAGVVVGSIEGIRLGEDRYAVLTMRLDKELKVPTDSMASVKSQGIIGDKYIQISLGGDEEFYATGDVLTDTESAIDIESLISKFAFGSAK